MTNEKKKLVENIGVKFSDEIIERMDTQRLLHKHKWDTRSHFIRCAVLRLIEECEQGKHKKVV